MRSHIGKHLLLQEIPQTADTCGFCGLNGCNMSVVSGTGNFIGPVSIDCKYFCKFNFATASKTSQQSPCSNRPMTCSICLDTFVWSYNMNTHYAAFHAGVKTSNLISQTELEKLKVNSDI